MTRHKHADLMIAYAEDTSLKLQYLTVPDGVWTNCDAQPVFSENFEYRIKPDPLAIAVEALENVIKLVHSASMASSISRKALDQIKELKDA